MEIRELDIAKVLEILLESRSRPSAIEEAAALVLKSSVEDEQAMAAAMAEVLRVVGPELYKDLLARHSEAQRFWQGWFGDLGKGADQLKASRRAREEAALMTSELVNMGHHWLEAANDRRLRMLEAVSSGGQDRDVLLAKVIDRLLPASKPELEAPADGAVVHDAEFVELESLFEELES